MAAAFVAVQQIDQPLSPVLAATFDSTSVENWGGVSKAWTKVEASASSKKRQVGNVKPIPQDAP